MHLLRKLIDISPKSLSFIIKALVTIFLFVCTYVCDCMLCVCVNMLVCSYMCVCGGGAGSGGSVCGYVSSTA